MATDCHVDAGPTTIGVMSASSALLKPHPDRLLPTDPALRDIAWRLYATVKELPIISPHGHVDPQLLVDDEPFTDPTTLLVIPDHYVTRLLHAAGVPLGDLGAPEVVDDDARHRHEPHRRPTSCSNQGRATDVGRSTRGLLLVVVVGEHKHGTATLGWNRSTASLASARLPLANRTLESADRGTATVSPRSLASTMSSNG